MPLTATYLACTASHGHGVSVCPRILASQASQASHASGVPVSNNLNLDLKLEHECAIAPQQALVINRKKGMVSGECICR